MIDEQKIANAQIMNFNLEIIDRLALELSMEVNTRHARILKLAELSETMPGYRLARIIRRARSAVTELEDLLAKLEATESEQKVAAE